MVLCPKGRNSVPVLYNLLKQTVCSTRPSPCPFQTMVKDSVKQMVEAKIAGKKVRLITYLRATAPGVKLDVGQHPISKEEQLKAVLGIPQT